jgi:hypothetical protein
MPKRYDQACPVARHSLVHADCGQPVQMGYYCPHCDQRVRGTTVQMQQG